MDEKRRTPIQNNSLHLYCQQVADSLNSAGLTIEEVLKHFTMELEWNKENVKEILWRTAQKRMLGKISTTELSKQKDIDLVFEAISKFLGERLHLEHIAWPSIEELEKKEVWDMKKK